MEHYSLSLSFKDDISLSLSIGRNCSALLVLIMYMRKIVLFFKENESSISICVACSYNDSGMVDGGRKLLK